MIHLRVVAGGGRPLITGDVHIVADAFHVASAGTWIGGLLSLALLFAAPRRAGSVPVWVATDYGHWVRAKIAQVVAMVCIAAFNHLHLTPRLSSARAGADAQRHPQRNSLIELTIGLPIRVIAGVLGMLPPGIHASNPCTLTGVSADGGLARRSDGASIWQNRHRGNL